VHQFAQVNGIERGGGKEVKQLWMMKELLPLINTIAECLEHGSSDDVEVVVQQLEKPLEEYHEGFVLTSKPTSRQCPLAILDLVRIGHLKSMSR
jgi:hypothetical protein